MAHLGESIIDRRRFYDHRLTEYKVPRPLGSVANRNSISKRGTVHYENGQVKCAIDFPRSRSGTTVSYEIPQYNERWRQERGEQPDNVSEDYIVPSNKPRALKTVSSVANHQSGEPDLANKGTAVLSSSNTVCKLLFFAAVFGIILIGITALVLGVLTMTEDVCFGSCSSSSVDSEETLIMRQQLARLRRRFQELKGTALSTINSTTLSTVINTSHIYEGCITEKRNCTVVPVSEDSLTLPQGPVCATERLRINRDVSFLHVNAMLISSAGNIATSCVQYCLTSYTTTRRFPRCMQYIHMLVYIHAYLILINAGILCCWCAVLYRSAATVNCDR